MSTLQTEITDFRTRLNALQAEARDLLHVIGKMKQRAPKGRKVREPSDTKTCPRCKSALPATDVFFYPEKRYADGLAPYCRQCRSDMSKARRKTR